MLEGGGSREVVKRIEKNTAQTLSYGSASNFQVGLNFNPTGKASEAASTAAGGRVTSGKNRLSSAWQTIETDMLQKDKKM